MVNTNCALSVAFNGPAPICGPKDCRTCRPINKERPAIDEPAARERTQERGLSDENKILLEAWQLIARPIHVIEKHHANIDTQSLFALLRTDIGVWNQGRSIDEAMDAKEYGEQVKGLIAHYLVTCFKFGIIFWDMWLLDYDGRRPSVLLCSETKRYYRQANKHDAIIRRCRGSKWKRGKHRKKGTIRKNARIFIKYLQDTNSRKKNRDKELYKMMRFDCALMIMGRLLDKMDFDLDRRQQSDTDKSRECSGFSIDQQLFEAFEESGYANKFVLIGEIPGIRLNACLISS
jgi:hypothetical protein